MPPILVTWTAHPARQRPDHVALVIAVVSTTAAVVLASFQSAMLAVLAVLVLLVSVASFLLPTRYCVTDDHIEVTRMFSHRVRRFCELKRLDVGQSCVLVSPFRQRKFLDRQRGLVLYLPGTAVDRRRLLDLLKQRIAP